MVFEKACGLHEWNRQAQQGLFLMIREREREKSREFMHERPSGVDLISLRRLGLWLSDLFPGVFSWQGYARASRVPARDRWEDREQRRTRVRPLHAWERQTIWGRETRIRRIRVEWKLKKIDDNREEKRVDKFMGMGVFVEDFWKTTS